MKKTLGILFLFTLAFSSTDQWLVQMTQNEISNPNGASPIVWLFAFLTVLLGSLSPLISTLLIFSLIKKSENPWLFVRNFSQNLIEAMRAWGKSFMWSFLLIIPGIIKFAQYFFVPFVVCFDPNYQRGQVDALEQSQKISKGRLPVLIGLLILFDAILPLGMSFFEEWSLLTRTPGPAMALCFVEMMINICFIWILWRIYESTVSMERNQIS